MWEINKIGYMSVVICSICKAHNNFCVNNKCHCIYKITNGKYQFCENCSIMIPDQIKFQIRLLCE